MGVAANYVLQSEHCASTDEAPWKIFLAHLQDLYCSFTISGADACDMALPWLAMSGRAVAVVDPACSAAKPLCAALAGYCGQPPRNDRDAAPLHVQNPAVVAINVQC